MPRPLPYRQRPMNPLLGIWNEPANVPGYCYASPNGEINDGSRPTANYSLLTANWTFTFSAKERDPETGLSYFGSRYYSSDLSVWLSVDPMSGKYPSLSPYTYCVNNPVKLVDPNGEEIVISMSMDENGNKVVNIVFTATLRNKTGKDISDKDMQMYKSDIAKGIERVYGRKFDDGTSVNVTVDIDVLSKDDFWDPLSTTRHQINIVEEFTEEHAGEAEIGGGKMELLLDLCEGKVNSLRRTSAHEFGHLLGLEHVGEHDNIMNEKTNGERITLGQIYEACNNYNAGRLNNNIRCFDRRKEIIRKASLIPKYKFQ